MSFQVSLAPRLCEHALLPAEACTSQSWAILHNAGSYFLQIFLFYDSINTSFWLKCSLHNTGLPEKRPVRGDPFLFCRLLLGFPAALHIFARDFQAHPRLPSRGIHLRARPLSFGSRLTKAEFSRELLFLTESSPVSMPAAFASDILFPV